MLKFCKTHKTDTKKHEQVNPGSKASLKGIREGDIISSINGTTTKDVDNSTVHKLLRNAGEQLHLSLNEDGVASPRRKLRQTASDSGEQTICPSQCIGDTDSNDFLPEDKTKKPLKKNSSPESSSRLRAEKKGSKGFKNVFRTIKIFALGKPKKSVLQSKSIHAGEGLEKKSRPKNSTLVKERSTESETKSKPILRTYSASPKKFGRESRKYINGNIRPTNSPPEKPKREHEGTRTKGNTITVIKRKSNRKSPLTTRASISRTRNLEPKTARKLSNHLKETSFLSAIAEEHSCK
ncbi:hypothetical protein RUM43_001141 [Polyplax serrata]|uniref:PDZ domain-containing protein n=1 Tax=Polyplax serrata TaxID=468196 RepID=A0AAN8SDD2_POLSC